ncbi:phosphatase PAP2 family protein [Romboutsia sp.]|uniref:phosphatase PAP2 family protein n=1 Tax=Romboutsia sp. TaxID=1965302 RepID=UPI003F2C3B76
MDIEISILQFLQGVRNPILDMIFLGLTISTELPVVVLFIAIMYWCINKKYGQKLLFGLVGNILINNGVKEFFKAPRPIGVEGLKPMRVSTATGYSFPSAHTQVATTFWVSLMIIFKKSWIYVFGTIIFLGVGISRLYLGVHWPVDVLCGWVFGIVFTLIFAKIFDIVDENKSYHILILMLIPAGGLIFLLNSTEYVKMLGLFTGFILGYIVEDKFIQFNTGKNNKGRINFGNKNNNKNNFKRNLYRFIVGIVTLGLVYLGLKYIMPSTVVFTYIRYTVIVFYAVAGAPALFKLLKLN